MKKIERKYYMDILKKFQGSADNKSNNRNKKMWKINIT